jgi:small subunit ribosomal protein S16
MDTRTPRDGRVIEELGFYDPMVRDTDARAVLKAERIDYWLSVGAQPSEKVNALIRKYGTGGKRVEKNKEALKRLSAARQAVGPVSPPPPLMPRPKKQEEPQPEAVAEPAAAAAEDGGGQ